jgi:hypothetical protein
VPQLFAAHARCELPDGAQVFRVTHPFHPLLGQDFALSADNLPPGIEQSLEDILATMALATTA